MLSYLDEHVGLAVLGRFWFLRTRANENGFSLSMLTERKRTRFDTCLLITCKRWKWMFSRSECVSTRSRQRQVVLEATLQSDRAMEKGSRVISSRGNIEQHGCTFERHIALSLALYSLSVKCVSFHGGSVCTQKGRIWSLQSQVSGQDIRV